ncbi:MAG TPA: histidine kinase [Bryobacteraceae bacterium]|nr:histidine kinase [Bryobacteraceae bacterium]
MMPTSRTAAASLVGWTAMGVLFALPQLARSTEWQDVLRTSLAEWWSWGLITMVIVAIDRRLPLSDRQIGWRLICHVPLSVVLTILFAYTATAMRALLGVGSFAMVADSGILVRGLQGMLLWSLLVYWLILGGWLAKQYYERYLSSELRMERLERLSTEARMHALRLQLDPHFLFNALNTISSQVETDPRLARAMIEHLGDLLRLSLEINQQQHVPLVDELAFLDHYLAIQRIRFGDRLRFEQVLDDQARHALVPSMTIQPLVENAIRHGISPRASGGTVRVVAQTRADDLWIRVEDDGTGLPADWKQRRAEGLGLSVTRQRLEGFYPDGKSFFDVRPREGGGVEVELRIPLSYAASAANG